MDRIDFSGLPDKAPPSGIDFSGLPDKGPTSSISDRFNPLETLKGMGETALTMATGMGAYPLSKLNKMLARTWADEDTAQKVEEQTANLVQYQPKSALGKHLTEAISKNFIEPVMGPIREAAQLPAESWNSATLGDLLELGAVFAGLPKVSKAIKPEVAALRDNIHEAIKSKIDEVKNLYTVLEPSKEPLPVVRPQASEFMKETQGNQDYQDWLKGTAKPLELTGLDKVKYDELSKVTPALWNAEDKLFMDSINKSTGLAAEGPVKDHTRLSSEAVASAYAEPPKIEPGLKTEAPVSLTQESGAATSPLSTVDVSSQVGIVEPGGSNEAVRNKSTYQINHEIGQDLKGILRNEKGALNIDLEPTQRALQNIKDKISLEGIPKLTRAGASDAAVMHASARNAIPKIVDDLLARTFPDSYKKPAEMAKTIDILNKDNILGGYDEFLRRAEEERKPTKESPSGNVRTAKKWEEAAAQIAAKHDLNAYERDVQAAKKNPVISANIDRWQKEVVPELNALYNEVKNVDPLMEREGRGRHFDARINLLSDTKAAELGQYLKDERIPSYEPSTTSYLNPNVKHDPFDRAARFTGNYSTDARMVLSNVLSPRWNEATKLRLYKALEENGAAVAAGKGVEKPAQIQGQDVTTFFAKVPETAKDGSTRQVSKAYYIRKDIAKELRTVLNTDMAVTQSKAAHVLTNIQLAQIADAVTHSKNILSVVTKAQGAGSVWTDIVRKMPVLGSADAIARLVKVTKEIMTDSPAIRSEIATMAKQGLIRPEYPATGLQKITRGQQFLHKVDTGSRVIMNRFYDNLVERGLAVDSPKNRRDFINQIGQYNKRLMGPLMRSFRESGFSPFIVAGRNYNVQGRRALTGHPGVAATGVKAATKMRIINLGGTAMLFTIPMMLNILTTGKPGGRKGTPLGAWDIGAAPDDKGKHRVIDLLQITGVRRGMRSIGLDAAIDGLRSGHTPNQISGEMISDIMSAAMHPWLGPAPGFAFKAATGKQLDLRGKMEAQQVGGGEQYIENFRAALESQNPLVYAAARPLFQTMGLDNKPEKPYATELGETFLKSPYSAFGVKDVYPSQTAAEKMAMEIAGQKTYGPMTNARKEILQLVNKYALKIREAIKEGKQVDEDTKAAFKDDLMNKRLGVDDVKEIAERSTIDPLLGRLKSFTLADALKVYEVATPQEKEKLLEPVIKKAANLAKHSPGEFAAVAPTMRKILRPAARP